MATDESPAGICIVCGEPGADRHDGKLHFHQECWEIGVNELFSAGEDEMTDVIRERARTKAKAAREAARAMTSEKTVVVINGVRREVPPLTMTVEQAEALGVLSHEDARRFAEEGNRAKATDDTPPWYFENVDGSWTNAYTGEIVTPPFPATAWLSVRGHPGSGPAHGDDRPPYDDLAAIVRVMARNGSRFVVYSPPDHRDDPEQHECLLCGTTSETLRTLEHHETCPVSRARALTARLPPG
jgi:hypothetical protein